jgi:hypothetical protein
MKDFNHINYNFAKDYFNRLMSKAEKLGKDNSSLLSALLTIELHKKVGLENESMLQREQEIKEEIKTITNKLHAIANDMKFMRRMTELNMPINFN